MWEEALRLAMEIPKGTFKDSVLAASLSLQFEPPASQYVRPRQLIWETWQLFEPEDGRPPILPGAEVIRRQFQKPYQDILSGEGSAELDRIATAFEAGFKPCPKLEPGQQILPLLQIGELYFVRRKLWED